MAWNYIDDWQYRQESQDELDDLAACGMMVAPEAVEFLKSARDAYQEDPAQAVYWLAMSERHVSFPAIAEAIRSIKSEYISEA